jgi:putative nucleotidyltransferase with HDIG domain
MTTKIPGIFGSNNSGPLILIFSPRERIRDIITVGLIQCNYQVIQAHTSYLATIKVSQILPKIVIADISIDNPKDILVLARLQKSPRMNNVRMLLILSKDLPASISQVVSELATQDPEESRKRLLSIGYPFAFAELLSKLKQFALPDESAAVKTGILAPQIVPVENNRALEFKLFDLSVPAATKLSDLGKALQHHWAFPFTVVKALDIIESDISCSMELSRCISTDPAVSSAILKIANTIQYARRHGRITEIKDAVVRLGFRETRNIMACLSLIDLSPEVYKNRGFGRREFWLHSLAVGVIAEKICIDYGLHRPELAFIAGLLHDLGKIPLDNNFDSLYSRLLDETMASITAFHETEQRLMGFTHSHLGHYLTNEWNFPSAITQAILNHHNPDKILQSPVQYDRIIQEAVFTANLLAKAASLGHSCDEILTEIPAEMIRELHLGTGPSERFFTSVIKQLRVMCTFLNLPCQDLSFGEARHDSGETDVVIVYNDRQIFHPIVIALQNNGFNVQVTNQFNPDAAKKTKVIIAMPDKGLPLDVIFYGDERDIQGEGEVLKIFLVDLEQYHDARHGITNANLIFMDRHTFDVRLLLNTLDNFLGKIVTPQAPLNIGNPPTEKPEGPTA